MKEVRFNHEVGRKSADKDDIICLECMKEEEEMSYKFINIKLQLY